MRSIVRRAADALGEALAVLVLLPALLLLGAALLACYLIDRDAVDPRAPRGFR